MIPGTPSGNPLNEAQSAINSSYGGLKALEWSGRNFHFAGTTKGSEHLGRLQQIHGQNAFEAVQRLIRGIRGFAQQDPQVFVAQGTGALSMRLGGKSFWVPIQNQQTKIVQLGASKYASAQHIIARGSGLEKLNILDAFVQRFEAAIGGTTFPGVKTFKTGGDAGAIGHWLQQLETSFRNDYLQSMHMASGGLQASRAHFVAGRGVVDLSQHITLRTMLTELEAIHKQFSMGKVGDYEQPNLTGLWRHYEKSVDAFVAEVKRTIPGANLAGIKAAGIIPHLGKDRTSDRIFVNLMSPETVSALSRIGPGMHGKGDFQNVLVSSFTREDVYATTRRAMAQGAKVASDFSQRRIHPVLVEKGFWEVQETMAAIRGLGLGKTTDPLTAYKISTTMPVKLGLIDPAGNDMALKWVSRHLGDSGIYVGDDRVRALMGLVDETRLEKLTINPRTKFDQNLHRLVKGMEPGETMFLDAKENKSWFGIGKYKGGRKAKPFRLASIDVGQGLGTDILLEQDELIKSLTRSGDNLFVTIERGGKTLGHGLGGLIAGRRVGVMGHISSKRQGFGVLGATGIGGLPFGKDPAFTSRIYLGHIFGRLQAHKHLSLAERTQAMGRLARGLEFEHGFITKAGPGRGPSGALQPFIEGITEKQLSNLQFYAQIDFEKEATRQAFGRIIGAKGGIGQLPMEEFIRGTNPALQEILLGRKAVGNLTQAERYMLEALKVPTQNLGKYLEKLGKGTSAQFLEPGELQELMKAKIYSLYDSPFQARQIDALGKVGPGAVNYRLTDLQIWEQKLARVMQSSTAKKKTQEAYQTIYRALKPSFRGSALGSDAYRLLGQFHEGLPDPHGKLRPTTTYTLQEIAQKFEQLPEGELTAGGHRRWVRDMFEGKVTLLSPKGKAGDALRRGGFFVDLGQEIDLGFSNRYGEVVGKRTSKVYVPGAAMFGVGWDKYGEQILQGRDIGRLGTKVYGTEIKRQLIGDAENVYRALHDLASGRENVSGFTTRLNMLYQGLNERMYGRDSIINKLFQPRIDGLMGRQVTFARPGTSLSKVLGASVDDVFTVGIYEGALKRGGMDAAFGAAKYNRKLGLPGLAGVLTTYPSSGEAHQLPVQIKLLSKPQIQQLMPSSTFTDLDLERAIFTSDLQQAITQRDRDLDPGYLTIFQKEKQVRAIREVISNERKQYGALRELLNLQQQEHKNIFEAADKFAVEGMPGGELKAQFKVQMGTPLAHTSLRTQRRIYNWIGLNDELVQQAIGGDELAEAAVKRVRKVMGDHSADLFGNAWTASIYAMLKKGSESPEQLTKFVELLNEARAGGAGLGAGGPRPLLPQLTEAMKSMLSGNAAELYGPLWRSTKPAATEMMKDYFAPMAALSADLTFIKQRLQPQALHLAEIFMGKGGDVTKRGAMDMQAMMGQLADLLGYSTKDMRQVLESPEAIQGIRKSLGHTMVETLNEIGPDENALKDSTKAFVQSALETTKRIWRNPWGKIAMVGGAVLGGVEMAKSVFTGDPKPVMPMPNAPMPPQASFQGMANRLHTPGLPLNRMSVPISRPEGSRTHLVAQSRPMTNMHMSTRGYTSALNMTPPTTAADSDGPEVPSWIMNQYLANRARSSF
jgi:hypothetical protein